MTGCPIELSVGDAHLAHQNAAVIQACVPLVDLQGDSYRLKDKTSAPAHRAKRPKSADRSVAAGPPRPSERL
jgi:hypothetical protein